MKNLLIISSALFLLVSCEMGKSRAAVSESVGNMEVPASVSEEVVEDANLPSDDFEETVTQVLKAFQQKDAAMLNQLIHKDKGLIIMHNPGAFRVYETTDKIDFGNPIPEYQPYESEFKTDYKLKYESLPEFECGDESWTKYGLFCDTINHDDRLSSNLKLLVEVEFFSEKWDWDTEIAQFEEMEKDSHMVILTTKPGEPNEYGENLIFSLTLIDGKWYLTLLDRVTPCSA